MLSCSESRNLLWQYSWHYTCLNHSGGIKGQLLLQCVLQGGWALACQGLFCGFPTAAWSRAKPLQEILRAARWAISGRRVLPTGLGRSRREKSSSRTSLGLLAPIHSYRSHLGWYSQSWLWAALLQKVPVKAHWGEEHAGLYPVSEPQGSASPLVLHPAKWLQTGFLLDPRIKELKPEYMAQSFQNHTAEVEACVYLNSV